MNSMGYLVKEGFKSLWKNRMMSLASVAVLVSCLLLTGIAGLLSLNLSSMMRSIEGNNNITIYLSETLPRLSAIKFGEELRKIENIKEITFQSKEDGMEQVIDMLKESGDLLSGLSGDENFLPDAYIITMRDLALYNETVEKIQAIPGYDDLTDYSDIANKLSNLDQVVRYASIVMVAVLGLVSLFIIANTIRVTMFARRTEINIMKSVGATNGFVRIPFVVEGMIIGIIAGIVSVTVLYFAYQKLIEMLSSLVPFLSTIDINSILLWLILGYVGVGILFGVLGSLITMGRYLKKEGENAVL